MLTPEQINKCIVTVWCTPKYEEANPDIELSVDISNEILIAQKENKNKMLTKKQITEAVGAAWTYERNKHKVMDTDLAFAIVEEIEKAILKEGNKYKENSIAKKAEKDTLKRLTGE
jgi:hypothetical protein